MDVFDVRERPVEDYKACTTSFVEVHDERVKRKDEKAFGEFRNKRLILDAHDRLEAQKMVHGDGG